MKTSAPAKVPATIPAKAAAQNAATDAKMKLNPAQQGTVAPETSVASSPAGVGRAAAPVATPAASVQPTP
jgi:hypothetical protein